MCDAASCVPLCRQRILAEKKARYSELAKRLEREKALALMERRMELKRHLQVPRRERGDSDTDQTTGLGGEPT